MIPSALGACAAQRETSYFIVVNKGRNPPECAGPSYPNDSNDVQLPFQPTTVATECRARPDEDGRSTVCRATCPVRFAVVSLAGAYVRCVEYDGRWRAVS